MRRQTYFVLAFIFTWKWRPVDVQFIHQSFDWTKSIDLILVDLLRDWFSLDRAYTQQRRHTKTAKNKAGLVIDEEGQGPSTMTTTNCKGEVDYRGTLKFKVWCSVTRPEPVLHASQRSGV